MSVTGLKTWNQYQPSTAFVSSCWHALLITRMTSIAISSKQLKDIKPSDIIYVGYRKCKYA